MFDYQFISEVKSLRKKVEKLYIYGAGMRGIEFYKILTRNEVEIDGFIVTEVIGENTKFGLPILEADTVVNDMNTGIVLGMSDTNTIDVDKYLKELKADFSRIIDGGKYLSEYRDIYGLRNAPFLEITPVIGCRVNCRFCPQNLLINTYFAKDKNRKRVMTTDDFEIFLKHTPDNCGIMFAGMAEPFLNPECTKLLQMSCDAGRAVRLYTTLEGAIDRDIDVILNLPLQFVGLHVADKKGYAHITVSEQYYRSAEKLINAKKVNSEESFVDDITAQAEPDERIKQLCEGRFEIITSVQDRAGNLEGDEVEKRDYRLTTEKFLCCYCGPEVNNHVVLPDGTLLLCQMDYGMKHVMGNLLVNTFDELRRDGIVPKVLEAAQGHHTCELLCDTCLNAKIQKNDSKGMGNGI